MIPVRSSRGPASLDPRQERIPDEKFRKDEHILKSRDFRAVYRRGRSFKKSGFVLSVLRNPLGHNRIGFSISSASVRSAVRRNRIRRLVKEAYRTNRKSFKTSYDIVTIVKKDPGKKFSYAEARDLLMTLANSVGVLL